MKKRDDPRHLKRKKIVQELFANIFNSTAHTIYKDIAIRVKNYLPQIDLLIEKTAPQFPVNKIARIDLAILRLAVFEFLYEKRQPPKVIIDEAVELAKEFGGDNSPAFVNGVLGTLFKAKLVDSHAET